MPDYRLRKSHRFDGVSREPGEVVTLPPQLGDWLAEQGVVELIGGEVVTARPAPAAPKVPRAFVAAPKSFKCCGWK